MNYHNITKDDLLNGEGIRTVLWVSGCSHHCKGCQNPITWDPNSGLPFDDAAKKELFSYLDEDYCSGLTLSGGDPLYLDNWLDVLELVKEFRARYGSKKTIWLYTGYRMEEISRNPILKYVDVVVDGKYDETKRNTSRYWVGSDNQLIWRKSDGVFIAERKKYVRSLSDISTEKPSCDCC